MNIIVDYGMGNLGSIQNMLKCLGYTSVITKNISKIKKASKIILPGVGAFDNGMHNLKKLGLISVLNQKVLKEKTPILGICLGMQLMGKKSKEGKLSGLGWIEAQTIKFDFGKNKNNLKIPHMGWNNVKIIKPSPLFNQMPEDCRFYFVHSYHVFCENKKDILTQTNYGFEFVSSFEKENIVGVQFHPEKSHKFGMKLFENFIGQD